MKVKIIKCSEELLGYSNEIGNIYEVVSEDVESLKLLLKNGKIGYVFKYDCIQINENLSVSLKIQPDGKTVVAECTHIADELRGKGVLAEKDGYEIKSVMCPDIYDNAILTRGTVKEDDYLVESYKFDTLEEAQHYVKIMNELIDEINNPKTNWSKVAVDTKVKITTECSMFKANFHSYVPSLDKVIVIYGDEIKAVNASEVTLC